MTPTKKTILWFAAVALAVVVADLAFGLATRRYIATTPLRGDYRSTDHIINGGGDSLLVLGSSVALNSVNTRMLSDSLGISAYNGGSNGQTFPYFLTMMEIAAERPALGTVILCMAEYNLADTGVGSRYNLLVPYYRTGHDGIDTRLESVSATDRVMLNSSLYRYNTIWFRILLYHFFEPGLQGDCGFIAKDIPAFYPHTDVVTKDMQVTDERRREFDRFTALCRDRGIQLIVAIPPRYEDRRITTGTERFLRERAARDSFELWFDSADTPVSTDSTLFYDSTHLNYRGADRYTSLIIDRLRQPRL